MRQGVSIKKILIIAGVVISFWLVVGFGLMSFLRQEKTVVSTERFVQVAKSQGRISVDVTHEFVDTPEIASAQVATVGDKDWQIEFDHLRQKLQASRWFSSLKSDFEAEKGNPYSMSSVSLGNFNTFSLTSNATYYLARVDNTLLYVKANETYKDDIKAFINELGY